MAFYLVTGGAGFIGSHIVAELVHRGERVRVFDNFSTGKEENLRAVRQDIELINGDLRDLEAVRYAISGVDYVLHQGALPSVIRSVDDPLASDACNVVGTLNLLIAARDAGVRRVVYASSSSVYGDSPTLPKHEDMRPAPKSPYAVSKLAGEHYCQVFTEVYGLETVCLRYFNVFGPRQDPTSQYAAVIPLFITALLRGQSPTVYGDGRQSRDFTYVSNNVQANLLAATTPGVAGQVFNIACGKSYTLLELLDALKDILDMNVIPVHAPPRPGDVRHSLADISRAQQVLGYRVGVSFEEGLQRTVDWYREQMLAKS
ncbi:MAG: SDR family oxidoreductase [Anaerolineae bacterium]|nr:SDR family oxidoreductase [Anaerolineae bacterium]MDH7474905.1 SDR family oxidoreductase [Anaerolineae bacterium]